MLLGSLTKIYRTSLLTRMTSRCGFGPRQISFRSMAVTVAIQPPSTSIYSGQQNRLKRSAALASSRWLTAEVVSVCVGPELGLQVIWDRRHHGWKCHGIGTELDYEGIVSAGYEPTNLKLHFHISRRENFFWFSMLIPLYLTTLLSWCTHRECRPL